MPSKPPASLLLDWMTASLALTPTTEPVAIGVLWRDNGVLTYSDGIPPVVTAQPTGGTYAIGDTVSFSLTATNATIYQWERSNDGGSTWANVSGATSSSYSFTATGPDDGARFRCYIVGPGGNVTSNAVSITVNLMAGALSVSNATPTDGDTITFSTTMTGQTSYQLWKDTTEYIWGGESLPLAIQVGPLDSGSYTLVGVNGAQTYTTAAVTLTVAESNLVKDDFTSGSPSGNWSSTSGVTITSNKMSLTDALGSGTSYLRRNISADNMRVRFDVNTSLMTAGSPNILLIQGATHAICNVTLIASGASRLLRFSPNVNGWIYGAASRYNFDTAVGYIQVACSSGVVSIELRWDQTDKSVWIYVDDTLIAAVRSAATSTFAPTAATYVQIGKNTSATLTGSYTIDNVTVKQGNPAATSLGAKSKLAMVYGIGQSNMVGAATNSWNAVTDAIANLIYLTPAQDSSADGYVVPYTLTTSNSTSVLIGLVQNTKLPFGYGPCIANAGVGSTSILTNPGWADDGTGLYRTRAVRVANEFRVIPETYAAMALCFQGFEGDVTLNSPTYTANIVALVEDMREAMGDVNVPLLIGGFSPAYLTGGPAADANTIRIDSVNEIIAESTPGHIGAFASSMLPTPLEYQSGSPQWIHFTAAGYRALAARYADAYISLFSRAEP